MENLESQVVDIPLHRRVDVGDIDAEVIDRISTVLLMKGSISRNRLKHEPRGNVLRMHQFCRCSFWLKLESYKSDEYVCD